MSDDFSSSPLAGSPHPVQSHVSWIVAAFEPAASARREGRGIRHLGEAENARVELAGAGLAPY